MRDRLSTFAKTPSKLFDRGKGHCLAALADQGVKTVLTVCRESIDEAMQGRHEWGCRPSRMLSKAVKRTLTATGFPRLRRRAPGKIRMGSRLRQSWSDPPGAHRNEAGRRSLRTESWSRTLTELCNLIDGNSLHRPAFRLAALWRFRITQPHAGTIRRGPNKLNASLFQRSANCSVVRGR
jgi:hypothetical protein